jgi:hypothetical protein
VATAPAGVTGSANPESEFGDRVRPSTDVALLQVVHMVLDEAWSPGVAAKRLIDAVDGDLIVLRRARARVLRSAAERPTPITERALATLDLALRRASPPQSSDPVSPGASHSDHGRSIEAAVTPTSLPRAAEGRP